MQLLWRHRLPLILLVAYWLLALGLYLRWERENWYPTTGDEPHHLDVGRSVVHHGTFDLTALYEAEAVRRGKPGDIPRPGEYHTLKRDGGLYSVRPIGTGMMAVPALVLTEVIGYHRDITLARASFVLYSGAAVMASWALARLYVRRVAAQLIAVALVCFSLPIVFAANQIFPDLPAGIVALCILAYVGWRAAGASLPPWSDAAALMLVAAIPFLHYKLSPMAVVLGAAVLLSAYRQGASRRQLLLSCCIPGVAAAAFFAYNTYALNNPFATPSEVHGELGPFVRWVFTFSLDRWHGFFLQNPAFFIGALFYVPFIRAHPAVAVPPLLCFVAAMGINSAHGAPGTSFAGRHAWTAAMMVVPALIYGVGCVEGLSEKLLYCLGGILIALQALAIVPMFLDEQELYNQPAEAWLDVYPSFFPQVVNRFLPAIYNTEWWSHLAINWLYIAFATAMILIGAVTYPRRRTLTLPAAGVLLAITFPLVLLVGFVQADPPREPRQWLGSQMHRRFGSVLPPTVEASVDKHSAGIWTFGPYINVAPGTYRVTFTYSADAQPDVKVGGWDVTGRGGRVRFAAGDLYGSNGSRATASVTLHVGSRSDGEGFEMRTYFGDVANVLLSDIVLEPAD